jgi:hypothetical protein
LEKDKPNGEKKLNPIDYLVHNYHNTCPTISWHNTTTHEIEKIIKSLKTKDSIGYEEITTKILKLSAPYISSPLTYVCNKILSDGIYPDRLKYCMPSSNQFSKREMNKIFPTIDRYHCLPPSLRS